MRIAEPFPAPPKLVELAYAKLQVVVTGNDEEVRALGPLERLDRPWDPTRCRPGIRREVWDWLDDVAAWVNHQYGWGVERLIPPCWPAHPHIVHELAVLADQRRTAGIHIDSTALEEWHRYSLPMFLDRMTARVGSRCVTKHDDWPAASRYGAFTCNPNVAERSVRFGDDAETKQRHLALLDLDTAEVIRPGEQP